MSELTLFDPPANSTATSRAAATSMRLSASSLRSKVLELIKSRGEHGATCDECEAELDLRHQTCSARLNELEHKFNAISKVGFRPTRSGRDASVYVAKGADFKDVAERISKSETMVSPPENERQARPLSKLPECEQPAAWKEAVETAPNGKMTAKHVEEVVSKRLNAIEIEPTEASVQPTKEKGVGVIRANEAINSLIRIPKNDALRKRGFQLVMDWIKHNQ